MGGGVAAMRYIESLLFTQHHLIVCGFGVRRKSEQLSKFYRLPFCEFSGLNEQSLSVIDLIIIATPPVVRLLVIDKLINECNYRGAVIIEKPLAMSYNELDTIMDIIPRIKKCAVACQRDFNINCYNFIDEYASNYSIKWGTPFEKYLDNLVHMFPHLASWIMCLSNEILVINHHADNRLVGRLGSTELNVSFMQEHSNQGVSINNRIYPAPNYRLENSKIVQSVLTFTENQTQDNMKRARQVTEILISLLKEAGYGH